MVLNKDELINLEGGKISKYTIGFVIGSFISILAGAIDGFLRPLACNK